MSDFSTDFTNAAAVDAFVENPISATDTPSGTRSQPVVLSFDVEEHHRIEAAAGLEISPPTQREYRDRMDRATHWILDELAERGIWATFFTVGQIAEYNPRLVRTIHQAGHEIASHGWDHRRILAMSPKEFREDLSTSRDVLEQTIGAAVVGYRAPTFSLVRKTAWALDILAELGFEYDSSIYPVRHDRYGVPHSPRGPFRAKGERREILEIPPATVRIGNVNLPVGGGGYFRLLPSVLMRFALSASRRDPQTRATMLYFHPWEFDPDQPRLALKRLNRFRTYVGIRYSQGRLSSLLARFSFVRAIDLAEQLEDHRHQLPQFCVMH